jgi:hypothetical protein
MKSPERIALGRRLGVFAITLFVAYAAAVLAVLLPPRILDPQWQLRFGSALTDNAALALVGLALLFVAAWLDPDDRRLTARRRAVSQWAVAAALGFLLLVPLQGVAAWNSFHTAALGRDRLIGEATERLSAFRRAIGAATTTADLQARIGALRGPSLTPAQLALPLPELRRQLLEGLERMQARLPAQGDGAAPDKVWSYVQRNLQVMVSALAYALSFAAAGQRPGKETSLWEEWSLARSLARRRREAEARRSTEEQKIPEPPSPGKLGRQKKLWGGSRPRGGL